MQTNQRKYNSKDVDMLIATSTLVETAISNKVFLQSKRTNWADPFFDTLKKRIDTAMQTYLGIDSAKELRQSTQALLLVQKQALKDLSEVKVQVEEDFKDDKTQRAEILNVLGFTAHLKKAQKGDQESLISLLFACKQNLTPTLKAQITGKGTATASLDAIIAYADTLKNANITQETFKGSKKTITADAIAEFNAIYDAVISVSKIAARLFTDKPHVKQQFSYSKVAKALNARPGNTPPITV